MSAERARVLAVDDEPEILKMLQLNLEMAAIRAETAQGPERALQMLRESRFDVVITDIMMPGMTGVELIPHIKREHPMCQVIVLTGYSNLSFVVQCLELGAIDFFPKSTPELVQLCEAVRVALGKADRWRSKMGVRPVGGAPTA